MLYVDAYCVKFRLVQAMHVWMVEGCSFVLLLCKPGLNCA